jgi:integrase/recombinase XerD
MKDLRGYMTEQEVRKLIGFAIKLRDRLLLRFLWVTGARISEVVGDKSWYKNRVFEGLKVKDIVWDESTVILDTLKRKAYPPPKRRVQIDRNTLALLKQFIEENNLRLEDKVFKITRERVFQIIRELGEQAGIKKVGTKRLHGHHLRHSHCVAYVKKNNNLEALRKLQNRLGHANINTTAHYLQFAPEEQKEIEDVFGKW